MYISIDSFAEKIGIKKVAHMTIAPTMTGIQLTGNSYRRVSRQLKEHECRLTHQCSDIGIFVSIITEDGNGNHSHRSTGYQQSCRLQTGIT